MELIENSPIGLNAIPFFTIGVTTYKRRELLSQTLTSLRNQTFRDFEVIIGNDDTSENPVSYTHLTLPTILRV